MKKGRWIKVRRRPRAYPKTRHQKRIAEAGKEIGLKCKGLKAKEFFVCRNKVLEKFFGEKLE